MLLFGGLADWGSIANIVLAGMSVFTAIVTACMLVKQHKLDKEKFEAQQLEHQPIFQLEKNKDETTLTISNSGYETGNIVDIYVLTVMCVDIYIRPKFGFMSCRQMCVPIKYYIKQMISQKLKGDLATFDTTLEVKDKLIQKEREIQNILADKFGERNVDINNIDLIEISYKDMYDKNRSVYYFDIYKSRRHHLANYRKSANMYSDEPIDIDDLDIQQIADAAIASENSFEM